MPVAIAGVAAIFLAVLAMAILESAVVFSKAVASIFSGWKISIYGATFHFGDHIASFVETQAGNGIKAIEHYLDSHVEPLVDAIRGPSNGPKNVIGKILGTLGAAATALRFIRVNRIPALINLINTKFKDAESYAHLLATENYNRILHYYNLSVAHTDHYFKSAISHADAVGQDAKHYAHVNDTILHNEIIHYYGEAQKYADDDLNKALKRADVVKVAAETFALTRVNSAIKYLSDVISHRLAPISEKAEATRVKVDNYIDDCGQPLCEGLLSTPPPAEQSPTKGGHGFAKDLPKLWELVEGLAFLGFLEEMIREPERAAEDTFTVANDTMGATVTAFRDLTGV